MLRVLFIVLYIIASSINPSHAQPTFTPPPNWVVPTKYTPGKVIDTAIVESPTDAIIFWRTFKKEKPALVLFSNDPLLQPIPAYYSAPYQNLIRRGTDQELLRAANNLTPDPFILPQMALSVALDAGLFAEVIWVASADQTFASQDIESFRSHLTAYGSISQEEILSLKKVPGGFSWTCRGTKVSAIHQGALPILDSPTVVHIDLSYFAANYLDEIRTPLFPLLREFLEPIQRTENNVHITTVSLSSSDGHLPLASRIIVSLLADLLTHPDYIGKPLPANWERYRKIRYLDVFFQTDTILSLYLEMEAAQPDSADIQYGLYSIYRAMKKPDDALRHLGRAVATDPAYALEYDNLAIEARRSGKKLLAIDMQNLAITAQPHNIIFRLHMVETLKMFDKKDNALDLIGGLQVIPWSRIYYPKVPELLDNWKSEIAGRKQ